MQVQSREKREITEYEQFHFLYFFPYSHLLWEGGCFKEKETTSGSCCVRTNAITSQSCEYKTSITSIATLRRLDSTCTPQVAPLLYLELIVVVFHLVFPFLFMPTHISSTLDSPCSDTHKPWISVCNLSVGFIKCPALPLGAVCSKAAFTTKA